MRATVNNKDVLPIIYYRPFKASELFIKHHFPKWDLVDYVDKFWHPERYFNMIPKEEILEHEPKYYEFKGFLNSRCFVYPIPFMTMHNLFLVHYVFHEEKIAINFHIEKTLIYGRPEPTEFQRLAGKLLKYEGWEILDLSELEFNTWTYD